MCQYSLSLSIGFSALCLCPVAWSLTFLVEIFIGLLMERRKNKNNKHQHGKLSTDQKKTTNVKLFVRANKQPECQYMFIYYRVYKIVSGPIEKCCRFSCFPSFVLRILAMMTKETVQSGKKIEGKKKTELNMNFIFNTCSLINSFIMNCSRWLNNIKIVFNLIVSK